ncbi:MAG: alpha/beta fold hydrolase [Acidimicrobiales bacterium]
MVTAPVFVPTSLTVDVEGPVNFVEFDGPKNGPTLVCVHGLGGSHLNWMAIAPSLAAHARVLALDLVGHGKTPIGSRSADIDGHRRLVGGFLRTVADGPVILIGNSMGGLVATLQVMEEPDSVSGLILIDPALPASRWGWTHPRSIAGFLLGATPGLGESFLAQRRRYLSPERQVHRVLDACCVDRSRIPADLVAAQVGFLNRADRAALDGAYLSSARSLSQYFLRPQAFARRLRGVEQPTLLLHGSSDRLVPLAVSRQVSWAKPTWTFDVAPGVGHIPMMEAPVWTLERITRWLESGGFLSQLPVATGAIRAIGAIGHQDQSAV